MLANQESEREGRKERKREAQRARYSGYKTRKHTEEERRREDTARQNMWLSRPLR